MQIRMAPMIDVVFLLLIYFLLAANFRPAEGFLPSELPRQITRQDIIELEPLNIYVHSLADGGCQIDVDTAESLTIEPQASGDGFAAAGKYIQTVLADRGRKLEDPVKIIPNRRTKWQHVVKTYDTLWKIKLRNIIFAMVD